MRQRTQNHSRDAVDRQKQQALLERKIVRLFDRCLNNLMLLADGVKVMQPDEDAPEPVFTRPPDRAANEYVLNRILGRPATRKPPPEQPVSEATKLDLSRIPLHRLEAMERWLIEANEEHGETEIETGERESGGHQIGDRNP